MQAISVNPQEKAYLNQIADEPKQDDDPLAYLKDVKFFPTRQFWFKDISQEEWQRLYDRWKEYHPELTGLLP